MQAAQHVASGIGSRGMCVFGQHKQCRIVIPGGQSGHVASMLYADLIPLWREGRSQPMPFARDQVEQHTRQRLVLPPE